MKRKGILLFALVVINTGCAFTPQAVNLRPQVQATTGSSGQGRSVLVTVVDERPRATLGTRGARGVGADLTLVQDLPTVVRSAVSDGLQRQGFGKSGALKGEL